MARDRIRDFTKTERLHNESRIQGSPGAGGRARIGGTGGSGGVRGQQAVGGPGRGTNIQHVTLYATASQTVASGGAAVGFDRVAGAPTEIRGFPTLLKNLTTDGEVFAIPIDVTGDLEITLKGRWGNDYKGSGVITFTRTRGTTDVPKEYDLGLAATRTFDDVHIGWEVRSGDTVTVALPNGSGSDQTLAEAELGLRIIELASPTSTVPQPAELVEQGLFMDATVHGWNHGATGPLVSATTLETGGTYTIALWGSWNHGSISPKNHDPEWNLSLNNHEALAYMSLDGGTTQAHIEPPTGAPTAKDPDKFYVYQVAGEGFPLKIAVQDSNIADNSGGFNVAIFAGAVDAASAKARLL